MLIRAIDVSSYQPEDLSFIVRQADVQHVIVRMYQSIENPPQSHSINQVASARQAGCSVSGYFWLYRDVAVEAQVDSVVALLKLCNVPPTVPVMIDWEEYASTNGPSPENVALAVLRLQYHGYKSCIYTRKQFLDDVWPNAAGLLNGVPLLLEDYNATPDLNIAMPRGFGASPLWGHQYSGSPLDLDVVTSEMVGIVVEQTDDQAAAGPTYEELQSYIGYLSHDLADGYESAIALAKAVPTSKAVQRQLAPHLDQLTALTAVLRGNQP